MNWKEVYKSKKIQVEDVLNLIEDNSVIVVGMTPMEPKMFLRNLHKTNAKGVEVFTCLNTENYECFSKPEYKE